MFSEVQAERITHVNELLAQHKSVHIQSHTGATLSIKNKNGEDFCLEISDGADNTVAEFHAPSSECRIKKRTWYALRELFAAAIEDQKESKSLIDKLPWWCSY